MISYFVVTWTLALLLRRLEEKTKIPDWGFQRCLNVDVVLSIRDLHKIYPGGVHAVKGVSFDVHKENQSQHLDLRVQGNLQFYDVSTD